MSIAPAVAGKTDSLGRFKPGAIFDRLFTPAGRCGQLIAFGGLLWILVAAWTRPGVPIDMAEMIGWGNQWQWGYFKHPPLPCWIGEAIWSATGSTVAIYAFSQAMTAVSLVGVYVVGRRVLSPVHALVCVASLQGSYYTHLTTLDLNHTIVSRACWSVAVTAFVLAIRAEDRRDEHRAAAIGWWIVAGVALGLGGLSKYYIGILAVCFAAVPIGLPKRRCLLKRLGPWLMVVVAAVIAMPHLVWLAENDFTTIDYVLRRGDVDVDASWIDHLTRPIEFIAKQAGVWAVLIAAVVWMTRGGKRASRAPDTADGAAPSPAKLDRQLLTFVVIGPILMFLTLSAISGASLRSMWGGPLWTFLPVWFLSVKPVRLDRTFVPRAFRCGLALCFVFAIASVCGAVLGPRVNHRASRFHVPTHALAATCDQAWREHAVGPLPIIAGGWFDASIVNMFHPDRPEIYYDLVPGLSPWTSDAELRRRGGVLLWEIGEKDEAWQAKHWAWYRERFPALTPPRRVELPTLAGDQVPPRPYLIGVVPPTFQPTPRRHRENP